MQQVHPKITEIKRTRDETLGPDLAQKRNKSDKKISHKNQKRIFKFKNKKTNWKHQSKDKIRRKRNLKANRHNHLPRRGREKVDSRAKLQIINWISLQPFSLTFLYSWSFLSSLHYKYRIGVSLYKESCGFRFIAPQSFYL